MLARCRATLAGEPDEVRRRVQLVQADMTSFALGRRFALITSPFRGFQHLTNVERQLACLARCHAHLAPGGRLVLDLFNPDPSLLYEHRGSDGEETAETVPWTGGRTIRWWGHVTEYQPRPPVQPVRDDLRDRGARRRHPARQRALPPALPVPPRGRAPAGALGFRVVELYGDYDRSPYGDDSPELIVVAQPVERAAR